jgi:hypothetical protein
MTPSRNESYICNSKPLHKRTCIFEKLHINPYFHTLHLISHNSTLTLQLLPLVATVRHLGCHRRLQFQAGTKTASPGDHVRRAGGTATTPLVRSAHLVLP